MKFIVAFPIASLRWDTYTVWVYLHRESHTQK